MIEFDKEKEHLKETLIKLKNVLSDENMRLNKFYEEAKTNDEIWDRIFETKAHIKNLGTSFDKPYFARIDFKFSDKNESESFYIGRHGISLDDEIVVTDWRAPISTLYYDSELGHCAFEAPFERIEGELELKRQFEIKDGKLLNFYDVNLITDDLLLQKCLNENNDFRLKSIVATIQKEQNGVIREKISNNIIVQGVAGSGKTTVALHRIAYLIYNYLKTINQNQYMVIGPNPVFLKYIENVLPDLDSCNVSQMTFEDFSKDYIKENINVLDSNVKATKFIDGRVLNDIDKFKCSLKYKKMLDLYINGLMLNICSKDISIEDFVIVSSKKAKKLFDSFFEKDNYYIAIQKTSDYLIKYVDSHNEEILKRYSDYYFEKFNRCSSETEKEIIKRIYLKNREEIKKCCRNTIRKYFSKSKVAVTKLYKAFVSSIDYYNYENYDFIKSLKSETINNIKNNNYEFEDLAALVYLKKKLNPDLDYKNYRHVVIDEAQDFGEFNFKVLKEVFESSTFSIFGDLAQSIYDYRGLESWNQVNAVMFNKSAKRIDFSKSYRTTQEIMSAADNVAEHIGLNRSDLVVRHGNEVMLSSLENEKDIINHIISKIEEYKEKGYKTVAIISKTFELSKTINKGLMEEGYDLPEMSINDNINEEKFSICTISNQLVKGLEFDAVIITNASEMVYSSYSNLDMKLLYVAITRALHELDIIYNKDITKPLKKMLKKI